MGFLKKLVEFNKEVRHNAEIREAREAGNNYVESLRRSDLVKAELQYRIESVISQLMEMEGTEDLVLRLKTRLDNEVYDYEDLLKMYGYDEAQFNIKKISPEEIWDPARYIK